MAGPNVYVAVAVEETLAAERGANAMNALCTAIGVMTAGGR